MAIKSAFQFKALCLLEKLGLSSGHNSIVEIDRVKMHKDNGLKIWILNNKQFKIKPCKTNNYVTREVITEECPRQQPKRSIFG